MTKTWRTRLLSGAGMLIAALFLVLGQVNSLGAAEDAALPPDLAVVPRTAAGFVSVRAGDLWSKMAADKSLGKRLWILREELEKEFGGLRLADLERITAILATPESAPAGVITTVKPYERGRILEALAPEADKRKIHDLTCHVSQKNGIGLHFVNDRVFLVGPVEAVKACLKPRSSSGSAEMEAALHQALDHHIVACCKPSLFAGDSAADAQDPAHVFQPLMRATLAKLVLDLGDELQADFRLTFDDENGARKGAKALRTGLNFVRGQLLLSSVLTPQITGERACCARCGQFFIQAEKALQGVTVQARGTSVPVSFRIPTDLKTVGLGLSELLALQRGSTQHELLPVGYSQAILAPVAPVFPPPPLCMGAPMPVPTPIMLPPPMPCPCIPCVPPVSPPAPVQYVQPTVYSPPMLTTVAPAATPMAPAADKQVRIPRSDDGAVAAEAWATSPSR